MGKMEKFKRAPGYIGAALAGVLGATEVPQQRIDAVPTTTTSDQIYTPSEKSESYATSPEATRHSQALLALDDLSKVLAENGFAAQDLQLSAKHVEVIRGAIDEYVKQNTPLHGGAQEGYDPFLDLWNTINQNPPANPVLGAFLLAELSTRMAANVNSAEMVQ